MHVWKIDKWQGTYDLSNQSHRTGVRLRFEKDVDPEVKRACKEFCAWLRTQYCFPVRVPIYMKSKEKLRALDGEMVSATFFMPFNKFDEPYIRIATGDYHRIKQKRGKDNALAAILGSIAHELTHYFQWINDLQLTDIGCERQAKQYNDRILTDYAQTREHP